MIRGQRVGVDFFFVELGRVVLRIVRGVWCAVRGVWCAVGLGVGLLVVLWSGVGKGDQTFGASEVFGECVGEESLEGGMRECVEVEESEVDFEVSFIDIPSESVESGIFVDEKIRIDLDASFFEDGECGFEHLVGMRDGTEGDAGRVDLIA